MSVAVAEELGIFGVKPSKAMDMLTGKRVSLGLSIEAYDREVVLAVGRKKNASLVYFSFSYLYERVRLCPQLTRVQDKISHDSYSFFLDGDEERGVSRDYGEAGKHASSGFGFLMGMKKAGVAITDETEGLS